MIKHRKHMNIQYQFALSDPHVIPMSTRAIQESGTGEPIVNVAKLRGAKARRERRSPSPRPRSQGTEPRAASARRARRVSHGEPW